VGLNFYQSVRRVFRKDWEYFKERARSWGIFNLIIPAPSLEQVRARDFNPFGYCSEWVATNCPEESHRPHFPPMYVVYPVPHAEWQRMYRERNRYPVDGLAFFTGTTAHRWSLYAFKGNMWSENVNTVMQWLKFGKFVQFPFSEGYDDVIPLEIRTRFNLPLTWKEYAVQCKQDEQE
jgi:hypothetical protein